jgi:LysM repeat protein
MPQARRLRSFGSTGLLRTRLALGLTAVVGLGLLVLQMLQPALQDPRDELPLSAESGESELAGEDAASTPADESSPYSAILEPVPTATPGPLRPTVHVVEPGETLLELSDRYGLRPESVLWANDLPDPDLIVVGTRLVIPPIDGLIYAVESGDRLRSIADRYGLDLRSVAIANGIEDPDVVHVGMELVLPGARPVAPSSVVAVGPNTAPDVVTAPRDAQALAAAVIQRPLPNNVPDLLGAAWLQTTAPHQLYSGPEPSARAFNVTLPASVRLERTGDLAGRRIPIRDPGDGRTRQATSGWIDVDDLLPARSPSPRELPRAYPADTRMDIFHAFVPYRGQLDGSPYAQANCGPTAIGMVLEAFGAPVPLSRLRAEVLDAQRMWGNGIGTLITALAEVVERHGLQTHGLRPGGQIRRWTLEQVRDELRQRRPLVVQVRYRSLPGREGALYYGDHYIVVTGTLDDGFLYNDPIDHDGPGWDRVISGERLDRAMNASDQRYARTAFAVSR